LERDKQTEFEMASKSPSIIISTVPNTAPVIARFGDGETDVELSFQRLGDETVLLVTTMVDGIGRRSEIGREIVGEEDAGPTATDLEWAAAEALEGEGVDGAAYPCGFEAAVYYELAETSKTDRDEYMRYAIAHNAAMIAAE
jgi:hypothetical protein